MVELSVIPTCGGQEFTFAALRRIITVPIRRGSGESADVHRAKVILTGGDGSASDTEKITVRLISNWRTLNVSPNVVRDVERGKGLLRAGEVVSITLSDDEREMIGIVRD